MSEKFDGWLATKPGIPPRIRNVPDEVSNLSAITPPPRHVELIERSSGNFLFGWFLVWLDRRRRRRTWTPVKTWKRDCVEKSYYGGTTRVGTIVIVGWQNGLGDRKVTMLKECLPPSGWGNPKRLSSDWPDALVWAHQRDDWETQLRLVK